MTVRRRAVGLATALAAVLLSGCASAPPPPDNSQEIAASLRRIEQQLDHLLNGEAFRSAEIQKELVPLEIELATHQLGPNHPQRLSLERQIAALKALLTARQ